MPKVNEVVLSGAVYGNSNTYIHLGRRPDRSQAGDIEFFAWSGDRQDPRSLSTRGEIMISVFDGKKFRRVKRSKSGINAPFHFATANERERVLAELVVQLVRMRGRVAKKLKWGWIITEECRVLFPPAHAPSAPQLPAGRRGRIKPGIRSETPEPMPAPPIAMPLPANARPVAALLSKHPGEFQPAPVTVVVVGNDAIAALLKPKPQVQATAVPTATAPTRRRRRRFVHPDQVELDLRA